MSSSKHITSDSGEPMLSARAAAARLGCAKDYVGKLLREGKLRGARIQGAWFVEESSIAAFEVVRAEAKLARASSLAQERKLENAAYRKANGLPEKAEEAPSAKAEIPAVSPSVPSTRIGLKSLLARNLAMVFGGVLLFCAVAYAGAMHQREVAAQKQNALTAALAQVESPFFGAHPIAFGVSLPQPASTSVARDIFSSVFSYLFGPRQMQYAGVPRAPQAPVAVVQPYAVGATSTIVYNTYPVVERAVGVAGGVTQEMLNERLLALQNYLLPKIDAAALSPKFSGGRSHGSGGGNGSVTSVDASGGTTGLAFLGGPVTSTGTFTLSGVLNAISGGTGTSTAPSYGQLLLGNASGGYDLVSTSSLGIAAGGNPSWGNIIGTLSSQTDLQNALDAKVSLSYLSGLDKGYFFSTTSAQYFLSTQSVSGFSTTSADYWKTQNNFFSTTSAAYFLAANQGNAFSTTSAQYFLSTQSLSGFSTTSADYWKTQNNFFSTTSSNYAVGAYISASSTVPHVAGGAFGDLLLWDGTKWAAAATSTLGLGGSGGGSVTSVNASGGTTGLTFTGGPVTSSGTLVLGGMLGIANGGTGTSTAPSYGQVLVGNSAGGYDLVSTSSLGLAAGTNSNGFSTTSADYWKTQNNFFSTTSANFWSSLGLGFSTTSATYFANASGLLSTSSLSALAPLSYDPLTGVFSIQQASGSQDGYLASADWSRFNGKLGTTSISGTYPVQYNQTTGAFSLAFGTTTANAWSQLQQFSLASTSKLSVYQNAYFGATATSTFSSSGALALAGGLTLGTITGSTQCLHVNAAGVVSGTGSDCGSGGGGGGATNFLDLTDTPDVYGAGQIFFTNQSEDALIADNAFTFDGTTLNAPGAVFTTLTVLGSSNVGTVSTGVWHGSAITDAYVADSLTISGGTVNNTPIGASIPSTAKFTNASSTNFFATSTRVLNSSTTLATIDALYVNNLNGPLQAVGGLVSATSSIGVLYGGTGLTAAPSYGQVLVGNSAGGYDLVSTSSLGLLAPSSLSALAPLAYDASTGTFSISQASGSTNGYLSSTDWTTFNNKISSTSLSGQSVISYNPSTGIITTQQGTFAGNSSSVYTFPGQLVVTSSTSLNTFTFANATGTNATTTNLYAATASSTNLYATNSFFGNASTKALTISALNGPLQATNGVVSATTSVGVLYGGTGLTAAPSYGTILVGNSAGGYTLTATNTLGLLGSTSISATGPLSYNVSTGVFSISQSGSSQNGYLSSTDWTTFNNKISSTSLSATGPLSYNPSTGVFAISQANGSTNGYLSSTDWTTFNNKISSTSLSAGAGISYNPSTGIITNTVGFPFTPAANYGSAVVATGTTVWFQNGIQASSTSHFVNADFLNATTTSLGINNETFTDLTGSGLLNVGGVLTLDRTGNWTGTFDGYEAADFLANGFSTTSADYWKTQRDFFSTTSAAYFLSQNQGNAFSTTSATAFLNTFDKGYFFSTTSASHFANSSTTIAKTYTANTFTALQTFNGGVAIGSLSGPLQAINGAVSATSTLSVPFGGTGLSSAPVYGQLLLGNGSGTYTLVSTSSLGLVTNSSLSAVSPLQYNSGTGVFSIQNAAADSSTKGAATFASSDFNDNGSGTITLDYANGQKASASVPGFLSTADWTTFNNKIASTSLSGSSVISYNSATGVITTQAGTFGGNASSVYTFPGDVITSGTSTTTNLYIGGKISGANLTSCSSSADKLLWNSATQQFQCGTDAGASGSDINWTHFNNSGIRVTTATDQVLIGFTSTSSLSKLEVHGGATFDIATTTNLYAVATSSFAGNVGFGTTSPSQRLTVSGGNILQTSGAPSLAASTVVGGTTYGIDTVGNYAYVAAGSGGLKIVDVTQPQSPVLLGAYTGATQVQSVVVSGKYAFIGDASAGLIVVDVSNPSAPSAVATLSGAGHPISLALSGRYLYAPNLDTGTLNIVDIANPANPTIVGQYATPGTPSGSPASVAVQGKYLYVGSLYDGSVTAVDISNPANPATVGAYTGLTIPAMLYPSGRYLYVADASAGLYVLDISNPASIALAGSNTTAGYYTVEAAGDYAYVTDSSGNLTVLDVHNLSSITSAGTFATGGNPRGLSLSGKYAFVTSNGNSVKAIDINGAKLPAASIGSLEAGFANIADNLTIGGDVFVQGGINAGQSGIFTRGGLAVLGTTTLTDFVGRYSTTTTATTTGLAILGLRSALLTTNAQGSVVATSSLGVAYGGTGLSSIPTYGKILVGNSAGGYTLAATNTLGLLGSTSISATGPLSYNVATGVFAISQSGASTDGYLSSIDWNSFNSRLSTTTLGLFDKGYFFSTTSAAYFLSQNQGNAFSTTSADYWKTQNNFFSTTSQNYYANAFRDWKIVNGALSPTTTIGVGVYASSTIGNGNQNAGLTISGGATTTGNAYFASNVGVGTNAPSQALQVSGNAIIGQSIVGANYTVAPLALVNSQASTLKTQLNLVNTGGGAGAGSAIDFYTYTTAGNGLPEARIGGIDDGNYSSSIALYTKDPGNTGNNGLVNRLNVAAGGNVGIGNVNPLQKLNVQGEVAAQFFTATSSSVNTFPNLLSINATTTSFGINSETFTDLTGSGLLNVAGTLTLDRTGDWTGTFDGAEGSYYLANSFSTTSANYWQSQNNFFSTTSANYWASQGLAFSTTSQDYYASIFRDWNIVAGALTPTTTLGIQVSASSTIGNGNQNGGLTVSGGATTTGNAYFAGNVGIGTSTPGVPLVVSTSGATDLVYFNRGSSASLGINFASNMANFNSPNGFTLQAGGTTRFYLNSSGSIGIGTSNPGSFFSIGGNASVGNNYRSVSGGPTNGLIVEGNVGIGTTSPYSRLSVAGQVVAANYIATTTAQNILPNLLSTNATTTSFGINAETFIDLTGSGLQNVGGVLTLDATGDWTGTFDGNEGGFYLANSFSTTSAAYFLSQNQGSAFSTTSAQYFVHSSTTIPKTYTANVFTNGNTFNGGLTISALNGPLQATNGVVSATTSVGVLYGGTGLTSAPAYGNILVGNSAGGYTLTATNTLGLLGSTSISATGPLSYNVATGVFSISQSGSSQNGYLSSTDWTTFNNKISSTSLSATGPLSYNPSTGVFAISQANGSTNGYLSSTDWTTFNQKVSSSSLYSYVAGNKDWQILNGALTPTTTLGIGVYASSTIGNGAQGGGLTVNGGATTTGIAYFATKVGIGTNNPLAALQVSGGYGYFTSGITLNRGAYVTTNVDGTSDAGIYTPGGLNDLYLNVGASNSIVAPSGNLGIGTTSPFAKLSVGGNTYLGGSLTATGTVQFTGLAGGAVAATANGTLYTFSTSTWTFASSTLLGDNNTFSGTNRFNGNTTLTNATSTGFYSSILGLNNEYFADLTGNGLTNVGGALTLDRTGDWTGTFDGNEGSYYLANSFSTTSAAYFLSQNQGNAFSTTSANYWASTGLAFSTTSANYWKTQNNFFSTTSQDYYANAFRDWKIVNGALSPTTTLGVGVYASSTIGNGTLGLTVNGSATTTGNAYIAGNVGIGTQSPSARLDIQASYTTTGFPLSVKNPGYYNAYFQGTSASNQASFYLENDRGSFASYGGFLYGGSSSSLGSLFGAPRADRLFMFADGASNLGYYVGTLTAQPFVIGTNNIERARVDGNGNLGIGTTSPFAKLSVGGNTYLGGSLTATGTVQLSSYANGALGVTSNGTLYTFSTSTWTFASSTLLADNNTFSGTNRFNGNTTLTNATSSSIYTSILGLNSEYFSDLTGSGLTNVGGALTLDRTGDWTGTFDGAEGSFYLANSFSTTSANYWSSLGLGFSTTSADYWKTQNNFFSTTSADYYVDASTTIPKTYSNNTFTGSNTFADITATNATTSSLYIGSLTGILKATGGQVSTAVDGTDYVSPTTQTVQHDGNANLYTLFNVPSSVTTGNYNVAFGYAALPAVTSGMYNVALGIDALQNNQDGSNNFGLGLQSLQANVSGWNNTAIGSNSLLLSTGSNNTAIGINAGANLTAGDNNIAIGYNASFANTTGSDQLNIGNTIFGDLLGGKIGIGTNSPAEALTVSGNAFVSGKLVAGTGAYNPTPYAENQLIAAYKNDVAGSVPTDSLITSEVNTQNNFFSFLTNSSYDSGIIFGNDADNAAGRIVYNNTLNALQFVTAGSEQLRIDSAGNLGIGTTSPFAKLSVGGNTYLGGSLTATGTVQLTNYINGALAADASGNLYTFSTSTWTFASSTLLGDNNTFSGNTTLADATSSSFAITSLTNQLLSTNGNGSVVSTTVSSPLTFSGNTLAIQQAGGSQNGYLSSTDWNSFNSRLSTTTLGLFDKGYFFSTTSAAYFLSQNQGNAFSTTSALYFASQGLAFSTTSQNYYATAFRDWKMVGSGANAFLTPSSTVQSIGVFGSSTIGNGNQNGGLTISGGATTTGNAYFGGNVGIGTASPGINSVIPNSRFLTLRSSGNERNVIEFHVPSDTLSDGAPIGQYDWWAGSTPKQVAAVVGGVVGTSEDAGFLQFYTSSGGGAANLAVRLKIDSNGNVGIGTTSPYSKLSVVGQVVAANYIATTTAQNIFPNLLSTNATTTSLGINAETFTDLTGSGLQNIAGALSINTTGDWTGTFDGNEGSYYLANSFSTTSAAYFLSQNLGNAFSTTSADYWKTARDFFSTTSAAYFLSQNQGNAFSTTSATNFLSLIDKGYFFSTTSANYWKTQNNFFSTTSQDYYANTFRDWKIVAGALVPTTTLGIIVNASSTIGNGVNGLTITGTATTTGTAYFAGNVGIGTTTPYARLSVAGEVVAANFTATSTTATSTFAGGLNVGNGALSYDFSSGVTSIDNLQLGALSFGADSGMLSWIDMPVTSGASAGTVESYSAQIDGNPLLTIYSESDGAGGIQNGRVGVGTTTPGAAFAVTGNSFFAGNVAATGTVQASNFLATGSSTLQNLTFVNATGTQATTTGFAITGVPNALLSTNANGTVYATTSISASYISGLTSLIGGAYPFPQAGNGTSTLTQFNGGLTAYGSSTIGNGTQAGGLTISGGATTTGNAYFAGMVGIGTDAPTNALTLAQGNSIALYNTADQTTNYERGFIDWSSNVLRVGTAGAGSGSNSRAVALSSGGANILTVSAGTVKANFSVGTGGTGPGLLVNGSFSGASTNQVVQSVAPTFNQSGTSGYTALLIQPTETALGSGSKYLIQAGTSTAPNLFTVSNTGAIITSLSAGGVAVNSSGQLYSYATSTWTFASSTLLGDNNRFTGSNTFAGNTTLTNATSSSFAITNIASGNLLKTTTGGGIVPAIAGTDYATTSGITALGPAGQLQTGATQTFATTSADANIKLTITASGNTQTFTPSWAGTLATSRGGLGGDFSASTGILTVNSGTVSSVTTSAGVAGLISDETGSGSLVFSASPTFTGTVGLPGLNVSSGLLAFTTAATTTIPNNMRYAYTIATSSTARPLFSIDTTSGSESVTVGAPGGDVFIGGVGAPSNLVFEESSTIHGQGGNTLTFGIAGDKINFAVGFVSQASSTIGDGTLGLTVNGAATTTGNQYVGGDLVLDGVLRDSNNANKFLNLDQDNFGATLQTYGPIKLNNYNGSTYDTRFIVTGGDANAGRVGIGTTSPWKLLSVGTNNAGTFAISTSTAGCAQFSALGELYSTGVNCGSGSGTGYPFALAGNATSTLTQFNGGLTAYASSTIGNGAQAGGLTINGGATTTADLVLGGASPVTLHNAGGILQIIPRPGMNAFSSLQVGGINSFGTIDIGLFGSGNLAFGNGSGSDDAGISRLSSGVLAFGNGTNGNTAGGFIAMASSTVGGGTQATGLTVSGGATTTGNTYVAGSAYTAGNVNLSSFSAYQQNGNNILYASSTNHSTAVGSGAGYKLYSDSGANYNTALGESALGSNSLSSADRNNSVGAQSMSSVTTGSQNNALGVAALYTLTDGWNNVAVGDAAGYYSQNADANVYIGADAGKGQSNQSQDNNVGVGYRSLYKISGTAGSNVALGYQAGYGITSGSNNIALGAFGTVDIITSGSNNILIGQDVQKGISATASNQLNIGNLIYATSLGSGNTLSSGNVGIGTTNPAAKLDVQGTASTTNLLIASTAGAGTRCLQVDSSGNVSANGSACGTGGGGSSADPFPGAATTTVLTFTNGANIPKLTNLTTNGFVKTTGSNGTLTVDTSTYLTSAITSIGPAGQQQTGATQTLATSSSDANIKLTITASGNTQTFTPSWAGTLSTARGGLGGDFSASTGILSVNSGTVSAITTSAGLAAVISDETGTAGSLVFSASPTFTGTVGLPGLNVSSGLLAFTTIATTTIPNNMRYAYTIATTTTGTPLFGVDTSIGAEMVSLGLPGGDVIIGDVGRGANLVFEENSTIHGQGTNLLTFGTAGDRLNFAVNTGFGTTSPFAKLSINANVGDAATTLFAVGSSTASATTTLFAIKSNGNVGIGTAAPASLLSIQASAGAATQLLDVASSSGSSYFHITSAGSVGIGTSSPNSLFTIQGTTGSTAQLLEIASSTGASYVHVTSTGNVGVGTTTPANKLVVSATAAAQGISVDGANGVSPSFSLTGGGLQYGALGLAQSFGSYSAVANSGDVVLRAINPLGQSGNLIFANQATGSIMFTTGTNATNDSVKVTISNAGNLGVGTTSPFLPLSVAGTAYITGNLTAANIRNVNCQTGYSVTGFDQGGNIACAIVPVATSTASAITSLGLTNGAYYQTYWTTQSGQIYAAGYNNEGELGVGSDGTARSLPVAVALPSGKLASTTVQGSYSAYAIMTDGTLYAWGYNGAGQLGVGDTTTRYLPTRVGTLTNVVQVMTSAKGNRNGEGSADTVCALTGSGQLYCWGYNGYGEVGNYTTAQQNSPVQVATTTDPIAQIEMGGNTWGHTCAITTTGKLYCWGRNGNGQVGNYTTNTQTFPTQVATSTGTVVQVQIGSQSDNGHTCSLNSLGAVTCWGSNDVGQLGLGDTTQRTGVVATSTGLASGVAKIALANYTDSYAITNAGTAYGWGYNNQGELGLGNTTQQNSPQLIPGLSGVTALVPGSGYNASSQYAYACAISSTSSTEVYCWGYNGSGQLGVGDTTQRTSPTLVVGATNATALAIGGVPTANQTCVIIADGTSKCWGYNNYGQLGVGDTVTARSPVNVKIAASNNTGYWNKNGNYLNYMLGNVGIGTTTPYGRLAVTGAGMGGNATFLTANSANITTFMVLDNGSVGIGTTSPGYKLSVGGDQLTSGAMIVNGNIVGGGSLIAGSTTLSSLNLTSDLSVANGGTGLSFFAPGAIIFGNGASPLATSSNLFWDSANNRLGIGTTSPLYNLDVFGTGRFTSSLTLSGVTSCVGGQALQTDASGNIACGTPVTGGISSAGGWSTNNSGRVALATSTDTVAVGATTTPYAKLSVVSGSTATTTLALVPVTAQTANVLDIYNSSGGLAAVVTAGGYLGLGTSTPGSILSIQGVGNFTTATSSFYGSGGINITSGCFAINGTCFAGGGGVWTQANASTTYTLFTRVGIGTTSPWAKFAIQANVGEAPQTLFAIASSSPSATSTLFSIDSSGLTTIGDPSGAGDANFQFAADVNAWSVGYYSGDKSFRIASSTNLATNVAFSISKSGGVGIGTNGPSIWPLYVATATSTSFTSVFTNTANTTTAHGLYVQAGSNSSSGAYMIQFARADGTTIGSITQNAASTVAYNTSSDRRVKENIATTTLGLSDLMRISVRDFDFISDPSHAKTTGFIAQELYGIYPYAVSTNGDNGTTTLSASSTPWSVDYGRVTPLIVKAVQDLNLKVDARGALQATATTTIAALLDSAQATSTAPWLGVFASASQTLKDAMSGFGGLFVQVFKDGIYATAGVFDKVFAQTITATVVNADVVNTKTLCLDDICVTKTQLKDLLDSQHVTPVVPPQNGGTGTTTPPGGTGTSTPPTGTSTPPINGDPSAPIVSVTGENPMMLQVGASYNDPGATVVDDQDENLSYLVSLDGGANMTQAELTLDTSAAGTHTITYTATDTQGNVGQAQRTIIVEAPVVIPPPDQGTGTTTDDGSGGDTASSTPQQ